MDLSKAVTGLEKVVMVIFCFFMLVGVVAFLFDWFINKSDGSAFWMIICLVFLIIGITIPWKTYPANQQKKE